ncbi:MinD-like ATPase involved in chromosome partitioning or flagellar assembly [Thermomonospora echinospora]|uniref:MinD-like ATPase involved in chromosome partitioning or flagellar assembly n=1 Tax=Thermomonospora echinospora TaxID=1992 RepID=A0A1H6A6Q5_9ACTN|nr:TcpE family conjugal transfer membrane protein [Thermomonospora echinospora]SEG44020.1 MinD-like ATPase involved in chromosome partitioning or flagellar assembly [Thermomonospora echinospora]
MDLPTYTNIWRIEKRLYKLYDLRLPMPLPLVQIGVFVGVFVPWVLLLMLVGVPLETPWHVLYLVPPGVLTWLATRPVIEGKRLTELLLSQTRYLAEPRTWCRLTPIREPREVVIVARVWRRHAGLPAPAAAPERAAVRAHRKEREAARSHPAVVPVPAAMATATQSHTSTAVRPAVSPAPRLAPDVHGAGEPARRAAKPWRRTTPRSISHESDAPPSPALPPVPAPPPAPRPAGSAEMERPPATPRLEIPPARQPGSGKRALASGIKRPGEAAEFWRAADRPAGAPSPERATGPQPTLPEGQPTGHSDTGTPQELPPEAARTGGDTPQPAPPTPPGVPQRSPETSPHQAAPHRRPEEPAAPTGSGAVDSQATENEEADQATPTRPAPTTAPDIPQQPPQALRHPDTSQPTPEEPKASTETGTAESRPAEEGAGQTAPARPAPTTVSDVPQQPANMSDHQDAPRRTPEEPEASAKAETVDSRAAEDERADQTTPVRPAPATVPDVPQQSQQALRRPDVSQRVPEESEAGVVESRAAEEERADQAASARPAPATAPDVPQRSADAPGHPDASQRAPEGAEAGAVESRAEEDEGADQAASARSVQAVASDIPQQSVEGPSVPEPPRQARSAGEGDEGEVGEVGDAPVAASTAPDIPTQAAPDAPVESVAETGPDVEPARAERAPQAAAGEAPDGHEPADGASTRTTRPDIPQTPPATVPDIPKVPETFGAARRDDQAEPEDTGVAADEGTETRPAAASAEPRPGDGEEGEPSRPKGPTKPWRDGLSRPLRAATTDALVWPPVSAPGSGPMWTRGQNTPESTSASPDAGQVREPGRAAPPPQVPGIPAAQGGTATPPGGLPPAAPPPAGQTPAGPPSRTARPPAGPPATGQPPAGPSPAGYPPAGASPEGRPPAGPPPAVRSPWPPAGHPAEARPEPTGRPEPGRRQPGDGPAARPVRPMGPPSHGRVTGRPAEAPGSPAGPGQGMPFGPPARPAVPPADQRVAGPEGGRPREAAAPAPPPAPAREVRSGPASPVRPRPIPPPPPPPPPSTPAITPPDLEQETAPGGGLRRLIAAVGGGHSQLDEEYEERLQRPFQGSRHIVVLGCTGGAGQTVTALMLGHTFAQYCGEPVVAIDVNPGPGALARRSRSDTHETLTGLITRADQVTSLTAMRRYTSQAKSGLDVIAAGKNPLQALDDRDYALAIRTIDRFYSITLLDAAAAVVARVLPHADQIVLVAPASADAPRAVAMTFEWLDGHGYDGLRSRAVTVINGVSRRSMDDVEQAEAVARGRCRALVRIPWDDHLSMDRAPRNELKSLRSPTRRAYLALAGVVAGGFAELPERYVQEDVDRQQESSR